MAQANGTARQRAIQDIERTLAHWREMREFIEDEAPGSRADRRRWQRKYGATWDEMHREAVEAVEMFEAGLSRVQGLVR